MRRCKLCLFGHVLALLLLLLNGARSDLYTSLGQMTKLVETEYHVTNTLRSFVDYQSIKLREAKLLLQDFDLVAQNAMQQGAEHFIGNPVNALLLLKKLTKDLQQIVDTLNTFSKLKGCQ